jgi:hypothetical protein
LCFFSKNYSSLYKCKPHYSFTRIDNIEDSPLTGNRSYVHGYYYGNMRTHYLSYRIRLLMRVTGAVSECDFYQSGHEMTAMYGDFCAIIVLYQFYVTLYKYKDKIFEETIIINGNGRISRRTLNSSNHNNEETLLINYFMNETRI